MYYCSPGDILYICCLAISLRDIYLCYDTQSCSWYAVPQAFLLHPNLAVLCAKGLERK